MHILVLVLDFIFTCITSPDYTLIFILVSQGLYLGGFLFVHLSLCLLEIMSQRVAKAGLMPLPL